MLCFQRDIRLLSEEHRPALRAGCMSLKLLQSWRTMASCRYNPGHNLARQLRPLFPWSVPARLGAWLRFWRLYRWRRALS